MLIILLLLKQIETSSKALKFKVNERVELLSIRIFLVKVILEIGQEKYLL